MGSLMKELWLFVKEERKWWLTPILVVLGLIGLLVLVGVLFPNLAPFVYPLM